MREGWTECVRDGSDEGLSDRFVGSEHARRQRLARQRTRQLRERTRQKRTEVCSSARKTETNTTSHRCEVEVGEQAGGGRRGEAQRLAGRGALLQSHLLRLQSFNRSVVNSQSAEPPASEKSRVNPATYLAGVKAGDAGHGGELLCAVAGRVQRRDLPHHRVEHLLRSTAGTTSTPGKA